MVEAGPLEPIGERRGRRYLARDALAEVWRGIREHRPPRTTDDPFALASDQLELLIG